MDATTKAAILAELDEQIVYWTLRKAVDTTWRQPTEYELSIAERDGVARLLTRAREAVAEAPETPEAGSSPTLTDVTADDAAGGDVVIELTTDVGDGVIYTVIQSDTLSPPSADQVKLGLASDAVAAPNGEITVTEAGPQLFIVGGATVIGLHVAYVLHENAAGKASNVVASAAFAIADDPLAGRKAREPKPEPKGRNHGKAGEAGTVMLIVRFADDKGETVFGDVAWIAYNNETGMVAMVSASRGPLTIGAGEFVVYSQTGSRLSEFIADSAGKRPRPSSPATSEPYEHGSG